MKKLLLLAMAVMAVITVQAAVTIPPTIVPYNVNYHWGIIDVNIAHGTVKYECDGTTFSGTLDGVSIPWEGHVIVVSDTLRTQMQPGQPYSLEKVEYQSGWYRRPKANYFRSNNYDASNPANYRNIAGEGQYDASNSSMEAITITSDMIGMYYYANEIDFESLQPKQVVKIPLQGPYAQELTITYLGKGTYETNNVTYNTYNCMFEYDYKGHMSGYPVQMRIDQSTRLPVFLSASIPVGKIEMIYNP